jgi:hypothetical protein
VSLNDTMRKSKSYQLSFVDNKSTNLLFNGKNSPIIEQNMMNVGFLKFIMCSLRSGSEE